MRLSEVKSERTFNLEINQKELQLLQGVAAIVFNSPEYALNEATENVLADLVNFMMDEDIPLASRHVVLETNSI